MRTILPLGLSLLSLLAACSPNSSAPSGFSTGGSGSTGGGPTDACISPTVGQSCSASGPEACQPANPCCTGYQWSCDPSTMTWQQLGLGCACQAAPTSFFCGTLACVPGQYCLFSPPSPDGGPLPDGGGSWYSCPPIPSSCTVNNQTPTCGCIRQAAEAEYPGCSPDAGGSCSEDGTTGAINLNCTWG